MHGLHCVTIGSRSERATECNASSPANPFVPAIPLHRAPSRSTCIPSRPPPRRPTVTEPPGLRATSHSPRGGSAIHRSLHFARSHNPRFTDRRWIRVFFFILSSVGFRVAFLPPKIRVRCLECKLARCGAREYGLLSFGC